MGFFEEDEGYQIVEQDEFGNQRVVDTVEDERSAELFVEGFNPKNEKNVKIRKTSEEESGFLDGDIEDIIG